MRKKILGAIIAIAVIGVGIFQGIPALADPAGPLDHVQIIPASVTLTTGATHQFTAQGYDASNATLTNLTYFWTATGSGGTINSTGLFTAGNTLGTYTDTVQVIAVKGNVAKLANATVIITSTAGLLDHVQVTPATVTMIPGGTQQFVAQGYDAGNVAIANLTYGWSVVGGHGSINSTGLFTAGATIGTFNNTVQASATQNSTTRIGSASLTVVQSATNASQNYVQNLGRALKGLFNSLGFNNLLGGQLQVKNGSGSDTIRVIPGVVQAISGNLLTVLPNGQTANSTFILESNVVILPQGTQLAVNDKVMVITFNDKVSLVVKITTTSATRELPPGLEKQDDDKREGKETPPGWSRGKKVGWRKNSSKHETESESDSD